VSNPAAALSKYLLVSLALSLSALSLSMAGRLFAEAVAASAQRDRSPVDLVLTADQKYLVTANQTSDSLSLVRLADGQVVAEAPCGRRPVALALLPQGGVVASATHSGTLEVFTLADEALRPAGSIKLGGEPHGVAVSPDGKLAYVALAAEGVVAVVDLKTLAEVARIEVGRWPRYLALTPDGSRLAVGNSGDGAVVVVDTHSRAKLFETRFQGLNIGHLQTSADGRHSYFPWMVYTDRPITPGNIREGWVLGNRAARVRLDEETRREAMALDPRGKAVADPHGVALTPDEQWLLITASGTHELVMLRMADLPLLPDGTGDHMKSDLGKDDSRFIRVPLGGRPMNLRVDPQGEHAYVANYLDNSVQVVNLAERRVERTLSLGSAAEVSLARRGEAIFYDAHRSADGWYSCHSCHYEGDTNAVTMDTKNDGSNGTYKMVLSLRNIRHTGPWFWHGWQQDLPAAVRRSLSETMHGPTPTDEDAQALLAFFDTLTPPPNSRRGDDGALSPAAARGEKVFASEAAACANCHSGKYFTDGQVHDVGLGSEYDVYDGYNTPSLVGAGHRARYLHHGRAESLDELLTDLHSPVKVSGTRELSAEERADLIEYLRSL